MRDTAERALTELCGAQLQFQVLGNAPLSFFKFKYPPSYQLTRDRLGAKVFIFKAYLTSAYHDEVQVQTGGIAVDYQWCTLEEMRATLDKTSFRAVAKMLHHDG